MNIPEKLIVHHSASASTSTAEDIDDWHNARWPEFTSQVFKNKKGQLYHVGYHYVIEASGKVVQCKAHNEEGAHTLGMNSKSIGVCLVGNFDTNIPTQAQLESFRKLYKELYKAFPVLTPANIVPHRKYANKSCYGALLSDTYFTEFVSIQNLEQLTLLKSLLVKLLELLKLKK